MSLEYDFFGKKATFDKRQSLVVEALSNGYVDLFSRNIELEIERGRLINELATKDSELEQLQKLIDASIAYLEPNQE
jgi:hypothetical protein